MSHVVGIIGGAPSGTVALERLVAWLRASPLRTPVAIHVFNRTSRFGAGDVYDPGQLECLLINVSAGDFNVWCSQDPLPVVDDAMSLSAWCRRGAQPPIEVAEHDHPPRALAGRYLTAAFEAIAANLPPDVTLHRHVGEVTDVVPAADRYRVTYEATGEATSEVSIPCQRLLLATGHTRRRLGPVEIRYRDFAERHPRCEFISDVYPVDDLLRRVSAGTTVAVKGMSLTFVDAVLALTEGVGGVFEQTPSGGLSYRPCGDEPARILPFSRSGLPAPPRSSDITSFQHRPVFFRHDVVEAVCSNARDGKINFENDLWPIFEREMEWSYYRAMMAGTVFEDRLRACSDDDKAIRTLTAEFHRLHPDCTRFDTERLLNPIGEHVFEDGATFHRFMLCRLRRENEKARMGAAKDPEKAAVEMWRFCRGTLLHAASFAGFTPGSQRRFHQEIWPRMQHLVFGPPLENLEKIVALTEVGLLDFSVAPGPEVMPCDDTGSFRLHCQRTRTEVTADVLVDARVSTFSLAQDRSPLYRNLRRRGLVRTFENEHPGAVPFEPGALDVSLDTCAVIGADGVVNPRISAIGAPGQGCHYENTSPLVGDRGGCIDRWAAHLVADLSGAEGAPEVRSVSAD